MSDYGREGGLDAPTRNPLNQNDPKFWDEKSLNEELERVFDICHTCRRCVSLCNAFPTLFDLIDESETMEVDGVAKTDYDKVVDQCYLCDLCYLSKCPYVPPHEWNVDFPHLMLRSKAVNFKNGKTKLRDRLITSTDMIGKLASKPILNDVVNWGVQSKTVRKALDKTLDIHEAATLPTYQKETGRTRIKKSSFNRDGASNLQEEASQQSVALFTTCYCNYNEPPIIESLTKILKHNEIPVELLEREHCCGMPKLELGDLQSVTRLKELIIPPIFDAVQK